MGIWEALATVYLSLYVLYLGMFLLALRWLNEVRENYKDLLGDTQYKTQQSWENALDEADEFADNPPWHVRVVTWPVYRKTRRTQKLI